MPTSSQNIVAGRYDLEEQLGRGGMGVVWKANDTLLKRKVAIKEVQLPDTLPESEQASMQARALREARAAARIGHPAAVTVFDVHKEDGRAFIVMELVDAPTLEDMVRSEGPLTPEKTAEVGLGVLSALEAAHAQGIVHRDVKPANVMVLSDGRVKLADFGIASLKDDPKITATGLVLGSPSFMAPEQAEGHRSGPASDLWALGATMFFAVEGAPPFDKGQPIPTLTAVLHEDMPAPDRAGNLEPVLRALLSKKPDSRPSPAELRKALEDVADGRVPTLTATEVSDPSATQSWAGPPPSSTSAVADAPREPEREPEPARTTTPARRRRNPLPVIATLLALAVVGVLIFIMLNAGDDPGPSNEAASKREANQEDPSPTPEETQSEAPSEAPPEPRVPAGWTEYTDEETGYRVAYPDGWTIQDDSTDTSSTDFSDPSSNTYLRVDWTDQPGPDAAAAWEQQAASFSQDHANYQEITIEETSFKGADTAAIWEFTYDEGGATLHALDLGFADDRYGFALYFQTLEEDWAGSQKTFEQIKRSFRSPPQ
ncbi:MAG: serine/threonine protein kinase [Actinobacteria bacterium]|nr:serine/threonine protein kinase [Actinomycetota bacterium]